MANAVFNSLENYFSGNRLRPRLDWAKFDMSNIRSMDCDMGIIYPHYIEDCLPGDKIKISNTIKVQALPLKNPIFNNIKLYTYYYYVPYYLLWHKFDRFIEGGRDGTYTAELPYIKVPDGPYTNDDERNAMWGHNTLWDYMGFEPQETTGWPIHGVPERPKVSAFPFAAYQRIYRDYFMNQDVQTSTNINPWFPEDDFNFQLKDGKNTYIGEEKVGTVMGYGTMEASEEDTYEDYPMLLALRPRNWNKDYFTSMWFSPQRGPTQAVNTYNTVTSTIDFTPTLADDSQAIGVNNAPIFVDEARGQIAGNVEGQTAYKTAIKTALNKATITTTANGGFTLADLHLAQQIEIWMERNMSVKAQYNEFLRIHFDDAPLDERLTKPAYIGGTVQDINISQVLQTSQTTETSAQGTATGHATGYENGYVGTYNSHEYGLIMGLCCIMPESYYNTGIDRHWTKTSRYDFYFPEFADLEPQAVLRKELQGQYIPQVGQTDTTELEKPIGYIGRYDEYRHHRNLAVGCFRNGTQQDFTSWVITRKPLISGLPGIDEKVALDQRLISTDLRKTIWVSPSRRWGEVEGREFTNYYSNIEHNAWATGKTVNPFIVQIGVGCEMTRPMPYVNDPTKQGR